MELTILHLYPECMSLYGEYANIAVLRRRLEALGKTLSAQGWRTEPSDPLRLTLRAPEGLTGLDLAERLRRGGEKDRRQKAGGKKGIL